MNRSVKLVCVFCGSRDGARPVYREEAVRLGSLLASSGFGLVYGGASVGLMGAVADAALAGGAPVVGVLPAVLKGREIAHAGLSELCYVGSMHERKALMVERADAFVALPGGLGTLDEFVEVLTWAQLGIHEKPCVLVNVQGYFDGLLGFLDHAVEEGMVGAEHRATIRVVESAEGAVGVLESALRPV